jgi:hypothetical protein
MKDYDAVVIGDAHNGLINTAFFAKAGLATPVKPPPIAHISVSYSPLRTG